MTRRRRRRRLLVRSVATLAVAAAGAYGATHAPAGSTSTSSSTSSTTTVAADGPGGLDPLATDKARATIAALEVDQDDGGGPDYDRDAFGQAWSDDVDVAGGHNGCDTRNDILHRDLTDIEIRPGTNDCVIIAGTLQDPYTGATLAFTKANAGAVQIDHVVPLAYGWRHGAHQWNAQQPQAFANDPTNLLALDGPTNQAKSDSAPVNGSHPQWGNGAPTPPASRPWLRPTI